MQGPRLCSRSMASLLPGAVGSIRGHQEVGLRLANPLLGALTWGAWSRRGSGTGR